MDLLDGILFRSMIANGGLGLERHCKEVNDLNVFPVPDGDTGTNMTLTMRGGIQAMSSLSPEVGLGKFALAMKDGMLFSARGNSGVILSQFFAGLAENLASLETASVKEFALAMQEGVKRAYQVVMKPVEGTILTVMREGCEEALRSLDNRSQFENYFVVLQTSMKDSLAKTPELLPVLKEAGVIDSGGAGLVYIIEGMAQAIGGQILEQVSLNLDSHSSTTVDFSAFDEDTPLDYGYCTEFILQLSNAKNGPDTFDLEALIEYFSTFGDSIVAFRNGNIVKVHVHTKTPDIAIAHALRFGEFVTFKMENMTLQHEQVLQAKEHTAANPIPASKHVKKSCVAVSPSPGIAKQFREYGVPVVIESTDLMNPDPSDFIRAFDQANADSIIVLPNNKNEIMVAHQAAKMYSKSWIYIVETPDVMRGIACASILDLEDLTLEDNVARMEAAIKKGRSIGIAKAAHAYRKGRLKIKEGDYVGIIDGDVKVKGSSIETAFAKILETLPKADEISVVTIFVSDSVSEDTKAAMQSMIEDIDSFIEVVILEGGQHLYDVLALVE